MKKLIRVDKKKNDGFVYDYDQIVELTGKTREYIGGEALFMTNVQAVILAMQECGYVEVINEGGE